MHATGAPFQYVTESGTVEFPLHTASEYESVINRCRAFLQKQTRTLADEHNLFGEARASFLAKHDPRAITAEHVDAFLSEPTPATDVLLKSLVKSGKTKEEAQVVIDSIPAPQRPWLAKVVAGLIVLTPKTEAKDA